jgi:hypothetical protein
VIFTDLGEQGDASLSKFAESDGKIPLTGQARSNEELLKYVAEVSPYGLQIVKSHFPPPIILFAVSDRDLDTVVDLEYIDHIATWEKYGKELKALGVLHYSEMEDGHPPGKCRNECRWPYTRDKLAKFRREQTNGVFRYALVRNYNCFRIPHLSEHESPCLIFDELVGWARFTDLELDPWIRSYPRLLAYLTVYASTYAHIKIEKSVHPDFVSFYKACRGEWIPHEDVHNKVRRVERLAKRLPRERTMRTELRSLLTEAQELTDSLVPGSTGTTDEVAVHRLLELVKNARECLSADSR